MSQPIALSLSIACESVVAWLLVIVCAWGNPYRAALAATVGTISTHWLAWSGILWLMDWLDYAAAVLIVETSVIVFEALAYRWIASLSWKRALAASTLANGASTALGLALYVSGLA